MAYEVLGDEKKRKIYDRYGLMGLQMYSNYGSTGVMGQLLFNPNLMCLVFLAATLIIGLMAMFPAFISVKIDGVVSWNWAAVFSPAWVLDIAIMLVLIPRVFTKEASDEEHHEDDQFNEPPKKRRILPGLYTLLKFSLLFLWQIFIVVKLTPELGGGWTWVAVWSPIYLLEALFFTDLVVECRTALKISAEHSIVIPTGLKVLMILHAFRWWVFRALQVAFIVIRSDGIVLWNWAIVALPFFIGVFVSSVVDYCYSWRQLKMASSQEERSDVKSSLYMKCTVNAICLTLIIAFVGMLVVYLNDGERTMAVVLTPLFIILGFLFCCCCCCLPLIYCVSNPGAGDGDIEGGLSRVQVSLTLPLLEPGPGNTKKWTIDDA